MMIERDTSNISILEEEETLAALSVAQRVNLKEERGELRHSRPRD